MPDTLGLPQTAFSGATSCDSEVCDRTLWMPLCEQTPVLGRWAISRHSKGGCCAIRALQGARPFAAQMFVLRSDQ